jgi:fatty acid desaturase
MSLRTITISSNESPQEILQSLERAAREWKLLNVPDRLKPPHTNGIRVSIHETGFKLAYEKTIREWSHPICVGSVRSEGAGSLIRGTIRFSRDRFIILGIWLAALGWGWFQGTLPFFPSIIIIFMLTLGVALLWLGVAFSSPTHEAETDALETILRRAANGELSRAAV